jgi:hypothetical protein
MQEKKKGKRIELQAFIKVLFIRNNTQLVWNQKADEFLSTEEKIFKDHK